MLGRSTPKNYSQSRTVTMLGRFKQFHEETVNSEVQ